ncbi:hypothetical protein ACFQRB_18680 [Halobaculum litoreum]|uniref:Uncharacterized protein n=1 Tax=Halobaculum litoreum TaxID=3031998 RepID=A0ABD5XWN8_9EURY
MFAEHGGDRTAAGDDGDSLTDDDGGDGGGRGQSADVGPVSGAPAPARSAGVR